MSQTGKRLRIAVDAMGGDYAPVEVVKGALIAAEREGLEVRLVGLPSVQAEIDRWNRSGLPVSLLSTDEYVQEGEPPAMVLRKKPRASVLLAAKMVRAGEADAFVSAGPTGSVMAAAMGVMGLLDGIERPVIGGPFVGFAPNSFVLDLGANVDSNPYHLLNFAVIGVVYVRRFLNIANPKVALLSVGSEEGKGNETVKEAYNLFQKSGLNFIGNIEGTDLITGKANVVVCDGFVGNILIKFCEGLGYAVNNWLRSNLKGLVPDDKLESLAGQLFTMTNIADRAGGGPILGTNGVAIKAHGRSKAEEIARAVSMAKWVVETNFIGELREELAKVKGTIRPQS
ncbi:MAG: phosphate acyltransferase PlsX [Dehalococcoidia bacterium]|nr:phosphate acyltransferase PlsX [Dehalococcoidia bacterium]